MKSIIYVALLVSFIPTIASAGWDRNRQIDYVYSGDAGERTSIKLVGAAPVIPSGCDVNATEYVFDESNPKFPWIWTLVLTSFTKGNPIDIFVDGCGAYNYPLIKDVILKKLPS